MPRPYLVVFCKMHVCFVDVHKKSSFPFVFSSGSAKNWTRTDRETQDSLASKMNNQNPGGFRPPKEWERKKIKLCFWAAGSWRQCRASQNLKPPRISKLTHSSKLSPPTHCTFYLPLDRMSLSLLSTCLNSLHSLMPTSSLNSPS